MKRRPPIRRAPAGQRGVALVTVLVIIVLVTVLAVAFTSRSRISASATASYSSGVAAKFLARDAGNTVVAGLQREMEAHSLAVAGSQVWAPNTPLDYLPRVDADSPFPVLLKTGTSMPGGLGPDWLSAIDTSSKSLNGRYYAKARWNFPGLLTPAQALDDRLPLPKWFYVDTTRKAGGLDADWRKADFDPVGRYAFRVYDLSGLLDINAVGIPGSVASDPAQLQNAGRKGSLAWLDAGGLQVAGLAATRSFFDWRGPSQSYDVFTRQFGQPYGFLVSPPATLTAESGTGTFPMGNVNRLLSRHDLVMATKASLFAGQFTGDGTDFAARTTIFSREVNAPSTTVLNQAGVAASSSDLQNVATPGDAINPFAPAVSVPAGHSFTRRDGSLAKEGQPLVSTRFPLSKINVFAIYHSSASTFHQTSEALAGIESYFGLKPNSDGTWRYVHGRVEDPTLDPTPGDPRRERFKTFAEIAAGNSGSFSYDAADVVDNQAREPDFFEYLQAAILGDSLGQGMGANMFNNEWSDTSIARHIFRIGVNLIDQYDDDDDPTVIARTPLADLAGTTNGRNRPDPDISGVENVPYVQIIGESCFRRFDSSPFTYHHNIAPVGDAAVYPKIATYYQFQLWNPHRNAPASQGKFRIVAAGDPLVYLYPQDATKIPFTAESLTTEIDAQPVVHLAPDTHWITFDVPAAGQFATPHLLASDDASVAVSQPQFRYATQNARILGFWCGDVDAPYNAFNSVTGQKQTQATIPFHDNRYSTGANAAGMRIDKTAGLCFQLQKQDAQGHWLPVQTMPHSRVVNHVLSDILNDKAPSATNKRYSLDFHDRPFLYVHYAWSDPRTLHLGAGFSQHYPGEPIDVANVMLPLENHFAITLPGWLTTNYGSAPEVAGALARYVRLARLSSNTPANTWYSDRGNTGPRLGDTAVTGTGTELYTDATQRPIILNRAFQSVAEMGYAFRDLPWKSLNFSQDVTAAGKSPADAALLDYFSLTEAPVRAGVINLNSASDEVIRALLVGTALRPGACSPDPSALTVAEAGQVAADIRTYLGNRTAPAHVLRTAADLPAMIQALPSTAGWAKAKREAILAAFADVHNGRTWNVLIDVVAQSGKFPRDDGRRERFQVTGEHHLLIHAAIDRITGKLVDEQSETAAEP